jgi:hypothetical protein
VKDSYDENCKTPRKEIEEGSRGWKELPYSSIGKIEMVKMATRPKVIKKDPVQSLSKHQYYPSQK